MYMTKQKNKGFRDIFNLEEYGFPEIPMFGAYKAKKAYDALGIHTHDAFEICYLAAGRQNYSAGGRDYLLKSGDIFMTKPGESHSSGKQPQEKGSLYWLNVKPVKKGDTFLGLTPELSKAVIYCLGAVKKKLFAGTKEIKIAFEKAHDELLIPPSVLTRLNISNAILSILLELIKCSTGTLKPKEEAGNMNRVIEYINDNIEEPMRVPELAIHMKLSESWFKARFKQETGLPPAEYIMRLKIKKAGEFLEKRQGNATDAAMKFGFASSQHFATAFRKYMNIPPSAIKALKVKH